MVYPKETFLHVSKDRDERRNSDNMNLAPPDPVPVSARAIPFWELLETGKVPGEYLKTEYVTQQFVERLVHYVLSIPAKSISIPQLSAVLEQLDARQQIFFFKRLKETSPHSLKEFAPLYYGFMAEFHPLLFT